MSYIFDLHPKRLLLYSKKIYRLLSRALIHWQNTNYGSKGNLLRLYAQEKGEGDLATHRMAEQHDGAVPRAVVDRLHRIHQGQRDPTGKGTTL